MSNATGQKRAFLFLQGPHGPFFHRLGTMLRKTGAEVWRVGFNAGDRAFWFHPASYLPYTGTAEDWRDWLRRPSEPRNRVTDIVLYGDTRPIHARPWHEAEARGLTVHVFEEGYMRPYWVTYERGGANGHSRLMQMSVAGHAGGAGAVGHGGPAAPGALGRHAPAHLLRRALPLVRDVAERRLPQLPPAPRAPGHGGIPLYLKRLLLMPFSALDRIIATARIRLGGFPYHLALLQLEHDQFFQKHSPFSTLPEFLDLVIDGFAEGRPGASPPRLQGASAGRRARRPTPHDPAALPRRMGVADRVHYVRGGKLARLLNDARTAVTVNSTAAQQVLWRGIPLKVFGDAVYAKPEFVSDPAAVRLLRARPSRPDNRAYKDYRRYLLETSQVPGGFYSARGRRQLLRQVVDMMLSPDDPYDALRRGTAAPRQQLRVVR